MSRPVRAALVAAFVVLSLAPAASADSIAVDGPPPARIRLEGSWSRLIDVFYFDDEDITSFISSTRLRVGFDSRGGFTPILGLGYSRFASSDTSDGVESSHSLWFLTLAIEGRYYLAPHRPGTQVFLYGALERTLVGASSHVDGKEVDKNSNADDADRLDRTGVGLGLGAEYKFSEQFALGGRWGLELNLRNYEDSSDTRLITAVDLYAAWRF